VFSPDPAMFRLLATIGVDVVVVVVVGGGGSSGSGGGGTAVAAAEFVEEGSNGGLSRSVCAKHFFESSVVENDRMM
jgi:hypothetical protein